MNPLYYLLLQLQGFKAIIKKLQKSSYRTQSDVCAAMGIDTSFCKQKTSHGALHDAVHEGHTGEVDHWQSSPSGLYGVPLLLVMVLQQ